MTSNLFNRLGKLSAMVVFLGLGLAACSDNDNDVVGPVVLPPPPPPEEPRVADPLPDPVTPEAAALQLGFGFAFAFFTNAINDMPIDDPDITDLVEIDPSGIPINVSDPS